MFQRFIARPVVAGLVILGCIVGAGVIAGCRPLGDGSGNPAVLPTAGPFPGDTVVDLHVKVTHRVGNRYQPVVGAQVIVFLRSHNFLDTDPINPDDRDTDVVSGIPNGYAHDESGELANATRSAPFDYRIALDPNYQEKTRHWVHAELSSADKVKGYVISCEWTITSPWPGAARRVVAVSHTYPELDHCMASFVLAKPATTPDGVAPATSHIITSD